MDADPFEVFWLTLLHGGKKLRPEIFRQLTAYGVVLVAVLLAKIACVGPGGLGG